MPPKYLGNISYQILTTKENRDILEIRKKTVISPELRISEMCSSFAGNLTISCFRDKFNDLYRKGGEIVYKKFEELLLKTNKTIYRVANDTGIATATLYDWRDGRSTPKTDKLVTLAKYFGVSIEYFLE